MKYVVIKSIVIAIFSFMLFGFAEGITFGIKAGMNISNMNVESMQSRIGFCGGGFATVGVGDMVVIQPEAMYTQKGAKWESWYEPEIITLKLDYINIPLLFKFMVPVKGAVKPNLFVGPYLGINVNATHRIDRIYGTSEERDYDEFYEDTDFGMVLGGGVDFLLKKGKFVLDGRYSIGLITVQEGSDLKNRVFSFTLGYLF